MKEPIVINAETREITVPETERAFGVAGERKVEVKHIRIEGRTVDGTDLTQGFSWKVSCENAGKELCADLIDGIVADAGNIEFDWIVGAAPMAYKGTLHFAVCAVRVDAAGNILQEWHSKLGTGDVANGIEATVQNIGGQDLLAHIQSITAAAQQNAAAAQRDAAAAAKSAEDAANSAAAAKDSEDAAASSATDAAKSQSAAAASERNAEASKKLAATSESNASASASAAAASETAAKASANKAQALAYKIPEAINTALAQAKESGEFDGPQGPAGPKGEKGEKGDPGEQGPAGADGRTPVKGTDYFTDTDKQEIATAASKLVTPESIGAAPISHVNDETVHVTADQKTAWDAKATTTYVDQKISDKVSKSGDTMTGKLTVPQIETGAGNSNFFQCRKFRGEGDANTYYHAVDFGYKNHDQVDFHEYGGIWNFFKNTSGKANEGSLCGKITTNGWEGNAKLTGSPTAPTPGTSDNSTRIATTAFVNSFNSTKLDKPNNPVVGQLLRVKSISDTGEITLETVADNDDNKLPTGGSTGQVLAKNTNSDYDVGWVDQTDALPDGGDSGQVLTKNSSTNGDASWKTPGVALPAGGKAGQYLCKSTDEDYRVSWENASVGAENEVVWSNDDLVLSGQGILVKASGNRRIVSNLTIIFTDTAAVTQNNVFYSLSIPFGALDLSYKMVTENGYRILRMDDASESHILCEDGFNTKTNKTDNNIAVPLAIYATTMK